MADGNNNNENNEQKKSTITTQVKNASKTGAKKTLKHLLKFLLPVVPILLIVMLLYALISLVVDFFQGIFEDVANFFTINLENGAYEIKDDEIDKVLEQLKDEYNLSAKDLGLLGDIDYDKASEEEKKAAERKYIKLFLEAQQTTQTINTQVAGSNGSVYMMTPKISENTITKYPDYSILWDENNPVISKEDFVKAVKGYTPPLGFGESGRNNWTSYEKFFKNNAEEFYDISTEAGINPMVMVAIGTHESGYGTSNIANEKLNLWGWGAYDSSPGQSAIDFDSEDIKEGISKGIKEVATSLKEEWTTPGTWRYERISGEGRDPTTLDGIGPLYCTTAGWSDLVKKHMLNIFGDKCKLGSSLGKYTVLEHEKDLEPMEFKKIDDFKKIVEKGGEFNKLRKYYSIDENGKLLLINFNYTNGVPNLSIQTIDYKSMISQYTTSCMFFIDTAMAVQNPKFMEAFVQMVKDSKITLNVMYNSSREVTTTTTFHYETTTNEDGTTSKRLVSSTNVVTQESYTPTIMVSTAKTWIFSREAGFKQTNLGPTYSHSDTGSGENRVIIDIESSGVSYSEETPKEEYNGGEKGEEGTFVGLLDKRFKIPNSVNRRSAGPDLVSNYVAYFEFLSRSSTTQAMENIMRYVLYKYTGKSYGVTEFDISLFEIKNFQAMGMTNLSTYLRQFSHSGEAPLSTDGMYYLMYGDGSGWPTIGNADIQWASHHSKFAVEGRVLQNGTPITVSNVEQYVNGVLGNGAEAQYSESEIKQKQIYIEKELVDSIGDKMRETFYNSVKNVTSGLNLSQQQMYALTALAYNFGSLPERNGYTFKKVYEAGAAQYEINSWQHTKFIWDNWWSYLGGMTKEGGRSALLEARDGAYETYVKGIYDLSQSRGGAIFGRTCYVFYTQSQISRYNYAKNLPYTRTTSNEQELFTYEEKSGGDYEESTGEYGVIGYYTSSIGRRFTILNQTAISGWGDKCNRAACAIIASGYSDESSTQLINKRNSVGATYFGAIPSDEYWSQYGLTLTKTDTPGMNYQQSLKNQLASGGYAMVWLNNGGTYYGKSGIKWTSLYHWVAIIDSRIENGVEQMCVADWRGISWVGIDEFSTYGVNRMAFVNEK